MEHIIINKIGDNYWYIPPILTVSRRKWHQRPYKSLKKLLIIEGFFDHNLVIRFNGDKDLNLFRMTQQLKKFPLIFKKEDLKMIDSGEILSLKIAGLKPKLYFDRKSLRSFYHGFTPFFSKQFLNYEFHNQSAIIWRKHGFTKYKKIL